MEPQKLYKKCPKCGIEKPLTEFYNDKSKKDKITCQCKDCMKAYQKVYSQSEKCKAYKQSEKYKADMKAYRQSEEGKVNRKAYRQSEKGIAYQKAFEQSEKGKANKKVYNQSEKGKIVQKAYHQSEKGKTCIKTYQQSEKGKINRKIYRQSEKYKIYMNKYTLQRYKTDLKFNLNKRMRTVIGKSLKGNKAGRHWEILVGYSLEDLIKRLKKTMPDNYTWNNYLTGELVIDHIVPIAAFNYSKPEDIDFKRCWSLENLRLLTAQENWTKNDKLIEPFQLILEI